MANHQKPPGLHKEDLLNAETDEMQETLRRLPKEVLAARETRIRVALELDFKGEVLSLRS